ncbi:molybdopterin cofactor synthesis protein MoaA [Candidatus Scalindua japonica]|uniref:Molybdopterin cofactor synthesis protein MoaA n=1 Tax=Candidatus Scalindua japonica TaxID=1284222 RepID=A0A286U446_9BACT|nr:radical SAM protein [Candidatus Scalindua japonica]GAX62909.1 molybdopterin cofactor synthesis protein MoaA [Candidatus Scalindua japonica]
MGRGPTEEYYKVLNEDYVEGTLTCLKPSTIKRVVNVDFPNILNIEPTNKCNLACVYCPRERADKGIGIMDWDMYTRIIDEASEYEKLIILNLHKDGESFLHPRFIDMIRYAKKRDMAKTIHMNTNAICWTDRMIDELLDSGIDDITVSIDAARPETFHKHKAADCLERVERQVRSFFDKREKMRLDRPFVRVKIMEFDEISKDEIREFFKKWNGIADEVQVTGIHSWSGEIGGVAVTDEASPVRYPCVIMWYALVINWNGESTVCSVDWNTEIKIGDAKNQSIHEIWNSRELKDARKSQIDKCYDKYHVCKDCVVWVSIGDLTEWLTERKEFYL